MGLGPFNPANANREMRQAGVGEAERDLPRPRLLLLSGSPAAAHETDRAPDVDMQGTADADGAMPQHSVQEVRASAQERPDDTQARAENAAVTIKLASAAHDVADRAARQWTRRGPPA
eukprot:2540049-Karenia_brevis.AAC.1